MPALRCKVCAAGPNGQRMHRCPNSRYYIPGSDPGAEMWVPQRIQRQRTKGWRMPEGAIYVGRPSKWGNPYKIGDESAFIGAQELFSMDEGPLTAFEAKELFRIAINRYVLSVTPEYVRHELRGCDLVCWCPLDQPCHADVLLELANS